MSDTRKRPARSIDADLEDEIRLMDALALHGARERAESHGWRAVAAMLDREAERRGGEPCLTS